MTENPETQNVVASWLLPEARGGGCNEWFSPPPPEAALGAPHSPLGLTNGSSLAPCLPDWHWVPARPLPELRWAGGEVGACPPEASLLGAVCGMVAVTCVWPRGPQLTLLPPLPLPSPGWEIFFLSGASEASLP